MGFQAGSLPAHFSAEVLEHMHTEKSQRNRVRVCVLSSCFASTDFHPISRRVGAFYYSISFICMYDEEEESKLCVFLLCSPTTLEIFAIL
jgi:hypothetical protein